MSGEDIAAVVAELNARLSRGRRVEIIERIECADGLSLSVQASALHYCTPRNSDGPWSAVEVGFPSREVPEIAEYAEDPGIPTGTVYGWVPIERVAAAILSAGGFKVED